MTKQHSPELRQQAISKRAKGATYNEIASELGVSYATVRYWTSESNRNAIKRFAKRYNEEDATRRRAYEKNYRDNNVHAVRRRQKNWRNANPHKRITDKLRRSGHAPTWLTSEHLDQIQAIYLEAASKGLQVDHIEPLNGKTSCGMHVPWNLQLLTAEENRAKWNSLDASALGQ